MKQYRPVLIAVGIFLILSGIVFVRVRNYQSQFGVPEPQTELFFRTSQSQTAPGDTITVELLARPNGNAILMVEPHIIFDPSMVDILSATAGEKFPNILSTFVKEANVATITVGTSSPREPVKDEVVVAQFEVRGMQGGQGSTLLQLTDDSYVGTLTPGAEKVNMIQKKGSLDFSLVQ